MNDTALRKDKKYVKDEIVSVLFNSQRRNVCKPVFLPIWEEIREFIKQMLLELEEMGVVVRFDKSKKGKAYKERCRWRLKQKSKRRSGRCSDEVIRK